MSTQPDLALWDQAVTYLYKGQPEQALANLELMTSHTSKTIFNKAVAYRLMERYDDAVRVLTKAIEMDPHLAIAYFERGTMYLKLKRYKDALRDFELGQAKLSGHHFIDYSQLGMRARLHQDEFIEWQKHCKYLLDGADFVPKVTPFDSSRETAFRPPQNKIANMHKMDYLGKPKVVTVLDKNDNFSGFSGLKKNIQSKSAPSSPVMINKANCDAKAPHSPVSPGPKPTRRAPLPPTLQKRLDAVTTMTPPPRRPVRLRKIIPDNDQSDDCFYRARDPIKAAQTDPRSPGEISASVQMTREQDKKLLSSSSTTAADLSTTNTSPENFCLQLFCGSRHKLQLSKDAHFSDLTSAIKNVCPFAKHQIMISKENGDFVAFETEQQLKDWWCSAPKTSSKPLTVFILSQ